MWDNYVAGTFCRRPEYFYTVSELPPVPSSKPGPKTMPPTPLPDTGWNPAIFLVLFGANKANRGIQTDDPNRYQLIWPSVPPPQPHYFCAGCPSYYCHPIYPDWGQTPSYSGLHTLPSGLIFIYSQKLVKICL